MNTKLDDLIDLLKKLKASGKPIACDWRIETTSGVIHDADPTGTWKQVHDSGERVVKLHAEFRYTVDVPDFEPCHVFSG